MFCHLNILKFYYCNHNLQFGVVSNHESLVHIPSKQPYLKFCFDWLADSPLEFHIQRKFICDHPVYFLCILPSFFSLQMSFQRHLWIFIAWIILRFKKLGIATWNFRISSTVTVIVGCVLFLIMRIFSTYLQTTCLKF